MEFIHNNFKKSSGKTLRPSEDILDSFKEHLKLLKDFILKLEEGDKEYYKSIMGELRVLVYKSRTNNPLIPKLAIDYNINSVIREDQRELSLEEYLNEAIFMTPLPVSYPRLPDTHLTRIDFIAKASQQEGGAHEDEKLDNDYLTFKGEKQNDPFLGILIDGKKPHIGQAIKTAKCIYNCGIEILNSIHKKNGQAPEQKI